MTDRERSKDEQQQKDDADATESLKGKDVMRGSQLTVNLNTGQATLGGGAKTPGSPATPGGRVQGVFLPNSN